MTFYLSSESRFPNNVVDVIGKRLRSERCTKSKEKTSMACTVSTTHAVLHHHITHDCRAHRFKRSYPFLVSKNDVAIKRPTERRATNIARWLPYLLSLLLRNTWSLEPAINQCIKEANESAFIHRNGCWWNGIDIDGHHPSLIRSPIDRLTTAVVVYNQSITSPWKCVTTETQRDLYSGDSVSRPFHFAKYTIEIHCLEIIINYDAIHKNETVMRRWATTTSFWNVILKSLSLYLCGARHCCVVWKGDDSRVSVHCSFSRFFIRE